MAVDTTNLVARLPYTDAAASKTVVGTVGNNGLLSGTGNTIDRSTTGPGGRYLTGLDHNGTDNKVVTALTADITDYPFSLGFWVDLDTDTTDLPFIGLGDGTAIARGFYIESIPTPKGRVSVLRRQNVSGVPTIITSVLPDSLWCQVLITYTSATAFNLFVNGVLVSAQTGLTSVSGFSGFNDVWSGCQHPIQDTTFGRASISGVHVFTRTTVLADAVELHNEGKPQNSVTPVIASDPVVGTILNDASHAGTWTDGTAAYQWFSYDDGVGTNPVTISGETSINFTPTATQLGKTLRLRVIRTNDIGSTTVFSNYSNAVVAAFDPFSITGGRSCRGFDIKAPGTLVLKDIEGNTKTYTLGSSCRFPYRIMGRFSDALDGTTIANDNVQTIY